MAYLIGHGVAEGPFSALGETKERAEDDEQVGSHTASRQPFSPLARLLLAGAQP